MNRFNRFLYGRYGVDPLGIFLICVGAIVTFILSLFRVPYYTLISFIPYGFALFRILSKDIVKRRAENEKFLKLSEPWRKFIKKKLSQFQDKDHRYFNCPSCHNTLRVPKNRGKIKISCPHCGREFKKRT